MKTKSFFLSMLLALVGLSSTFAQVGIGTQTPHPSSILDLTATDKGFFPPRLTTAQRDLITSPAEGLTIFNTDNKYLEFWNATDWISACNGSIVNTIVVGSFNCSSATFSPSVYQKGFAYTGTLTIPYTGGSGKNYSQYVVTSTGNTDFTATLPAGTLAAGAGNLVFNVTGTSSNGTPADFAISFGTQSCNATLTTCGALVAAGVWKEFLCHNLGANTSLDPHDMAQTNAWGLNGAYIQWGRRGPNTTGDSRVDWVTAANTANFAAAPTGSTLATANSGTIAGWSSTAAPNNSWRTAGGAKTANDPCPAGYRVPTNAEWIGVFTNNTVSRSGLWTISATYYNSALHYGPNVSTRLLTLPAAGLRNITGGAIVNRGGFGNYWSSTEAGVANGSYMDLNVSSVNPDINNTRTFGYSLRCIAE